MPNLSQRSLWRRSRQFKRIESGVSAAKGLAFSLGIPIIGVNSLEVAAYQYAKTGLPICAIFNAGRSEIATRDLPEKIRQVAATG